jgi:hypothetical protein
MTACLASRPANSIHGALEKFSVSTEDILHDTKRESRLRLPMSIKILIAPSGFKECLGSADVADSIAAGILQAVPDAKIHKTPLVDGGEGFTKVLVNTTSGTLHTVKVTGPIGHEVEAHFGFLGGAGPKTAVLEMAAAAGLRLVPRDRRDPLRTTTFGVGELIKAALDAGAERIIIGCGDSGTTDGGAGMAQALGVDLLDARGQQIPWGGGAFATLKSMSPVIGIQCCAVPEESLRCSALRKELHRRLSNCLAAPLRTTRT